MLLFWHNPDQYTSANIGIVWSGNANYGGVSGGVAGVRADGYLGRPALTGVGGDGWVNFLAVNPAIHPVGRYFRCGGRFLFEAAPAEPFTLMAILNIFGTEYEVSLVLNPDMTLSIYRGDVEIKSSNQVLALDTTYRLGFKGLVHVSAGVAEVWIGSTPIMKFAGNTSYLERNDWGGVQWGLLEDSAVNHIYMGDNDGFHPDLIPGLLVKNLFRASDGTFQEFAPIGAATVAAATDDTDPDGDTTTAVADVVGDRDTGLMETLEATAHIYGIQCTAVAKTIAENGPGLRHLVVAAGAPFPGYNEVRHVLTTEYLAYREVMYFKPEDGFGWYRDAINDHEFGPEVLP